MAREKLLKVALALASVALVIVIVEKLWQFGQTFSNLLAVLAGAWFLSLVLRPFIDWLRNLSLPAPAVRRIRERFGEPAAVRLARVRMPGTLAVALVYITALVFVFGAVTVGVATLIEQITSFSARLPEISTKLPGQISALWLEFSRQFGFDPSAINQILSPDEIAGQIRQSIGGVVQLTLGLSAGTANLVWQLFLMLILSLFITTEGRLLRRQFILLMPKDWHDTMYAGVGAMGRSFDGYLSGTLLAALIRAVITLAVCSVFQVSFGVVIALQYAILSFIPLLGSPIGIVVAAIITLIVQPQAALPVTIILIVSDQIVAYVVLPRILRATVGVPGLVGLIAVTVGVQLFGFWGLIFGIPVIGALYALLFDFYLPRLRANEMAAARRKRSAASAAEPSYAPPAPPVAEDGSEAGGTSPAGPAAQTTITAP